ncbi:unnamed protein product [Sphacelaria rigidula]
MDKYTVGLVLLQLIAGTHVSATLDTRTMGCRQQSFTTLMQRQLGQRTLHREDEVKVILESLLSIDPSKRMELDSLETLCMSEGMWAPVASDNSVPDLAKDIENKIDNVRQLLRSR